VLEWALLGDAGFRVRQWTPDITEVEVVDLGSVKAARMTLQPGWRWSECIKPIVGRPR
jgi:hypothetical protein